MKSSKGKSNTLCIARTITFYKAFSCYMPCKKNKRTNLRTARQVVSPNQESRGLTTMLIYKLEALKACTKELARLTRISDAYNTSSYKLSLTKQRAIKKRKCESVVCALKAEKRRLECEIEELFQEYDSLLDLNEENLKIVRAHFFENKSWYDCFIDEGLIPKKVVDSDESSEKLTNTQKKWFLRRLQLF